MIRLALSLLAAVMCMGLVGRADAEALELRPVDCWIDSNAFQTVDCYRAVLPLDRADPTAGTVDLPVAVLRASTDNPQPDPVIYLEGGPGAPTFESGYPDFESYDDLWWSHSTPFRRQRDFILFEQRGIGMALPSLDCPELHDLDAATQHWPGYDDPVFDEEITALAACHDRLVAEGIDLAAFDTRASADDVADIVTALGYGSVNLYGVSYGTRLGLEIMRRHPDLVRSAVLDGVYPPDIDAELDFPAAVAGAFANLFADCAADPGCRRIAPDAQAHLEAMVEELNQAPRELELYDHEFFGRGEMVRFDGTFVLSSMVDMLYDAYWLTYIPLVVGKADRGERDALSYFYWSTTFASQGMAEGAFVNIECREAATLDTVLAGDAARAFGVYGEAALAWSMVPYCAAWPVARDPLAAAGPVVSDIPSLLMSGRYDPVTPAGFADHAAQSLADSAHLVFRSGGHAVTFWFDCARDAAAAFIENPDTGAVGEPRCRDFSKPADFAKRF
jgi:pimeloyl-ACP methyl ester carboxylesterase